MSSAWSVCCVLGFDENLMINCHLNTKYCSKYNYILYPQPSFYDLYFLWMIQYKDLDTG